MGWVGRILAWTVILGIGAIVMVAVLIPRVAGATPYVVLTGSMRPAMPPGTMVVARPVDSDRLGIGDVITYQLKSGDPMVVTHRIVAVGDRNGHRIFQTRGDANEVPDQDWVRPVQIRGERWYAVPYLGYVTSAITREHRTVALVIIVTALLGYSVVMFGSAARDRLRAHRRAASTSTKGELS